MRQRSLATSAYLVVLLGARTAQTEKVNISLVPRAGQTIHYDLTNEFSIDTTSEGGAKENQPSKPAAKFGAKSVHSYVLNAGGPNPQGRVTSQMTVEAGSDELRFNDIPSPKEADRLAGQTFTVVFDAKGGDTIDITAPAQPDETLAGVKLQIAELYRYVPAVSLSIGETVEQPAALAIPMTMLPKEPYRVEGRLAMTLVSVEREGRDRIARCTQTYDVRVTQNADPAIPTRGSETRVHGSRTLELNLDRGMVRASQMESTFERTETPASAAMPTIRMHGVMKATVAGRH